MLRRHRKRAPRPHPENFARAGRYSGSAGGTGALDRRKDRQRAGLCRRARGRDVRGAGRRRGEGAGQRDRAARAQFRPLDAGRRLDLAIRAAHPRHRRLAARQAGAPRPGDHDQSDRRRHQRLRAMADRSRRDRASYGKGPPRPGRKMGHVTEVVAAPARNSRRSRDQRRRLTCPPRCRPAPR